MFDSHTEVDDIIWGSQSIISPEIFQRWCQGFEFSENEYTALKQYQGGPCSIIASVQAHIFKIIYFNGYASDIDQNYLLVMALTEILKLISRNQRFKIAFMEEEFHENIVNLDKFKTLIKYTDYIGADELEATILSIQPVLISKYGVLCYLYSVVVSYGVVELISAISDETNCLIDSFHGHSSQCLTNLLIAGQATPYLFDNEKDLGGYIISGIVQQPNIGFLTIMEYLRYCEVGWNFKNPKYPIWILASETHLTVFCSKDQNVIEKDNNILKKAQKAFNKIDISDQGFIMTDKLSAFLELLEISTESESLDNIEKSVDPEKLGILLKTNLLKYLFPQETENVESSYKFPIIHYNGLIGSNTNREVRYVAGEAIVEDFSAQSKDYNANDCSIIKCLRTKWPTISLKWENYEGNPSLN